MRLHSCDFLCRMLNLPKRALTGVQAHRQKARQSCVITELTGAANACNLTCVAVFHLPQLLTATAWCASWLQLAAHSLKADMVISRPMMAATSKVMLDV